MIQNIKLIASDISHVFGSNDLEIELKLGNITNDFWGDNISMVSAIVGRNGTGKSSLLRYIKEHYGNGNNIIYYSPHLDYRDNYDFDSDDNDISLDNILRRDLEWLFDEEKESGENGSRLNPKKDLKLLNTARQMDFLASTICQGHPIFSQIFEDLRFGMGSIILRGLNRGKITISTFHNTPEKFRNTIIDILQKCNTELNNWTEIRRVENRRVVNQHEVNAYIFKRNLIISFLTVVVAFMEMKNDYLNEGVIEDYDSENAIDSLRNFVENAKVYYQGLSENEAKKIFNPQVMELFDFIYALVDEIKDDKLIRNKSFNIGYDSIDRIRRLQTEIINHLAANYYYQKIKMNTFLGIESTDRILSSGENALLNLYSLLNEYTQKIEEENSFAEYILLLDEADLGFHPQWKKKFVNSIVKSLPSFFKFSNSQAKVQIIFTTHDPLTLSDIPKNNVIFLDKDSNGHTIISSQNKETFGANIHDLLADSFFMSDGLMGEFAKEKIDRTIKWLRYRILLKEIGSSNNKIDELFKQKIKELKEIESSDSWVLESSKNMHREIIDLIDEPLLRYKMNEMYYTIFSEEIDQVEAKRRITDIALNSGLNIIFGQ